MFSLIFFVYVKMCSLLCAIDNEQNPTNTGIITFCIYYLMYKCH